MENDLPLNLYSPVPLALNLTVYDVAEFMCEAPAEGEACSLWDPAIGMCQVSFCVFRVPPSFVYFLQNNKFLNVNYPLFLNVV